MNIKDRSEQSGSIAALFRYPVKKAPPIQEKELLLLGGLGIEGDFHANRSDRQISLLTVGEKEWMEKQTVKGFCFHKYKENILLAGIDLLQCRPGDLLACQDVEIEISSFQKRCHSDLCQLYGKENCPFAGSYRFGYVKRGGVVRTGMEVRITGCQGNGSKSDGIP